MIKLFTLKNISAFSSDAIYKVCLALDGQGFAEENTVQLESYDDIFTKALSSLEQGDHAIIAVETGDYINAKKELISKLILELSSAPRIAEAIAISSGNDISEIDMEGHCIIPRDAKVHLTKDGLYSGFTLEMFKGKLSYIPLDFVRIDPVLVSISEDISAAAELVAKEEAAKTENVEIPEYDFTPAVRKLIVSLSKSNKKVALSTGEATMWVYNLYDKIGGLTETINFVEVVDAKEKDAEGAETVTEEPITSDKHPKVYPQPYGEQARENESMRIIRHAREAMYNTSSDFGGAISDIYSTENESGQTVYFAYVAVVDRSTARAKKINTTNIDDLSLILPHAITILSDVVCEKAATINTAIAKIENVEKEEPKVEPAANSNQVVLSKSMMIFACIILVFSLLSPMVMTYFMLRPQTVNSTTTTAPSTSAYTYESSSGTTTDIFAAATTQYTPPVTESTAPDVSAATTTNVTPSESGTFTFYVFGYGHGVGMSQVGADYLAKNENMSYAEILAHYYYDSNTKLVLGDTYPDTISYAGTAYETRAYLASALESEMGSSFSYEALKAQAIAIYTFAKYNNFVLNSDAHAFGKTPSTVVYSVVDDVMQNGFYISYAGDVALTPFHAMSAGVTTSYYNVWGKSMGATVPYLSGGRKSYGDYLNADFKSTYTISSDDLKALVASTSNITLTGDPSTWISIISHDSAVRDDIGYVSSINVGGTIMTGNNFRINVMQGRIRSHCFAIVYTPSA